MSRNLLEVVEYEDYFDCCDLPIAAIEQINSMIDTYRSIEDNGYNGHYTERQEQAMHNILVGLDKYKDVYPLCIQSDHTLSYGVSR